MTMYAKVIADSVANDIRLTTLELYYPLMIHAQLMTHRMLSRNAQSNRAMPVAKMLEQVRDNPAMPSHWGKNQSGMNADEELMSQEKSDAEDVWSAASYDAVHWGNCLNELGVHKQVANRLTMPFQYIKVIVTATEWDNFFKLRLNDADPTMMELARKMKEAVDASSPVLLEAGEWHLPYITEDDPLEWDVVKKLSAARCARVSYNNHDNSNPDIEKDLTLAERLLKDGHMSPFEHQATPMEEPIGWECIPSIIWSGRKGVTHMDMDGNAWSGNFRGFIQYRQLVG